MAELAVPERASHSGAPDERCFMTEGQPGETDQSLKEPRNRLEAPIGGGKRLGKVCCSCRGLEKMSCEPSVGQRIVWGFRCYSSSELTEAGVVQIRWPKLRSNSGRFRTPARLVALLPALTALQSLPDYQVDGGFRRRCRYFPKEEGADGMPLLSFWKSARDDVLKLSIEQVVASAGDGSLRDKTEACEELRQYLRLVPSEQLFAYARHCLENPFAKSGLALQDVVNELGRRLDFEVENGPYQGTRSGQIGFDGIWQSAGERDLVIEVKTTDAYTISLDTLGTYKERLASENRVHRDAAILIVVSREDTGALEAQVRGSRYAWEMRLISIERLIKLVQVKEKSDDPDTLKQVRQLLQPFEYTKIDRIIDVVFTTTIDVESQQALEDEDPPQDHDEDAHQVRTDPELLDAMRQKAVDAFASSKGRELVRRSRTLFWTPDRTLRVCSVVSKRYERESRPYWYAFRPKWDTFLAECKDSYFILSCMDRDEAYAMPYSWIAENKKNLYVTDRGEQSYWHITFTTLENGSLAINLSKIGSKIRLAPFSFKLTSVKL
jgi:hypothetical protein